MTLEESMARPSERRSREPDPAARRHPLVPAILARLDVMQPMFVVGDRLNGRSLLLETAIHPDVIRDHGYNPENYLFAWITAADTHGLTAESFWLNLVLPQFCEEARRFDTGLASMIQGCASEGVSAGVDEALYLIRKKFNRKPVIAWDGFEEIPANEALDMWFFAQLRAYSQTYELNFLIGSSKRFEAFQLSTVSTSPFSNIFYLMDLEKVQLAL